MSSKQTRYDEEFKQSLVSLYNNGKTQTALCQEYGVSSSALSKWIKQYLRWYNKIVTAPLIFMIK